MRFLIWNKASTVRSGRTMFRANLWIQTAPSHDKGREYDAVMPCRE